MSKKTNSLSLRSLKNKSWASKSFFEDFNYSKILYQDLYITDYIKNILQYQFFNGIVQDVIIQRKRDIIYINVSYYSLAKRKKNSDVSFFIAKLKKKNNWRSKRKFFFNYLGVKKKRIHKYQKYILRVLEVVRSKKPNPAILKMRLVGNRNYLSIFSLRRLLLLNLVLLTGCRVNLYFSNLANLVNFPVYSFKVVNLNDIICFIRSRSNIATILNKKKILNKNISAITQSDIKNFSGQEVQGLNSFFKSILYSVKELMKFLKIPAANSRLSNLDMIFLVHLIYTSFILKSPNLLGVYIGKVIKRNIKSFNFFFNFFSRTLYSLFVFSSLRGLKIQFKGRLGISLRKKKSIISFGPMPLQTISSDIRLKR